MSEDGDTREPSRNLGGPVEEGSTSRGRRVKLLFGRLSCIIGLLLGLGGIVAAFFGGGASVTSGAVGAILGVLGYFLGTRRLATTTVLLCVATLFFGLAASQGLIPGIEASK